MGYLQNFDEVAQGHAVDSANFDRTPNTPRMRKTWAVFQSLDTKEGLKEVDRLLDKCAEVKLYE